MPTLYIDDSDVVILHFMSLFGHSFVKNSANCLPHLSVPCSKIMCVTPNLFHVSDSKIKFHILNQPSGFVDE